jgi:NAD(P)-dependent dehydrogenase (short-subunit alcohol dehydrogenase family)
MQPGTSLSKFPSGRVALVTGSTSGIGLGIARALAESGAAVVLNGLGKSEEIEATQQAIGSDFGVTVAYSGADSPPLTNWAALPCSFPPMPSPRSLAPQFLSMAVGLPIDPL